MSAMSILFSIYSRINYMSQAAPEKRRPDKRRRAKKNALKDTRDFRLLEAVKLTKRYLPVTINGHPVAKIIDLHSTGSTTPVPKKTRQKIVAEHLERVSKRDPQQPLYLSFVLTPSDPDFPFDLALLKFNLTVPATYPRDGGMASLIVLNSDIPRGFAVNIERGFRLIALLAKNLGKITLLGEAEAELTLVDGRGLLSQVQTLDKYLELFLKQEKRQTMKFVTFKQSRSPLPTPETTPAPPTTRPEPQPKPQQPAAPVSSAQLEQRTRSVDEMTTKLSQHVKLFNKSAAEARYKVRLPVTKPQGLPRLWAFDNKTVDVFLTVPMLYPDTPPRLGVASNFSTNLLTAKKLALLAQGVSLVDLVEEARFAEANFKANAAAWLDTHRLVPLTDALNWVANNLGMFVVERREYEAWERDMASFKS